MGATSSSHSIDRNTNQIRKLRSKHLSKQEIRNNIQTLITSTTNKLNNNNTFTDTDGTLNWNTDSNSTLGYRDSMIGGTISESENLRKLNKFISNLNSENDLSFDTYQNEIKSLENYVNQNGGFAAFEGLPLNITHSNYLEKMKQNINMVGGETDNSSVSSLDMSDDENSEIDMVDGSMYNQEINNLDKYIKQNGGYNVFEGRLLNIVNSNVLAKLQKNKINNPMTETTISTLDFTDAQTDMTDYNNILSATSTESFIMNGGGLSETSKLNDSISTIFNNTINNMNGGGILSPTSDSSKMTKLSKQSAGSVNTFSATSNNTINNMNGGGISSPTSDSSKMTKLSKQSAGSVNTFSATSNNTRNTKNTKDTFNMRNLPNFSDTSFSESILKGGNRNSDNIDDKNKKKENDSSSTSELEDSSKSSSSNELNNDDSTDSSDDTIKMARMIARQREVSDEIKQSENPSSSSSVSDSSEEEEEESESSATSESSESSDNKISLTTTESTSEPQLARTKKNKNTIVVKNKKTKKSKKRILSENSLSVSTEFKAVPFYSSDNSTDFYRSYQNRNRFN